MRAAITIQTLTDAEEGPPAMAYSCHLVFLVRVDALSMQTMIYRYGHFGA
jgi:hypothetical protein